MMKLADCSVYPSLSQRSCELCGSICWALLAEWRKQSPFCTPAAAKQMFSLSFEVSAQPRRKDVCPLFTASCSLAALP
ncbi:hypothetical protein NPIL_429921 [Nephila pilipes]|uniref:Uncharacterized protein n=1 Tax=Nephila pilipes TaxID=299642 RepID=A0A8X6UGP7_NEPPI|nr:hypothetical protein NPIL_429921 [Nephila pilipes]